jgi:hypothetical protein
MHRGETPKKPQVLTFLLKLSPKRNVKGGGNRNGLGSDLTLAYDSAPGSSAAERKVRGFHSRSETDEGEPLQNESIFFSPVFFFFLLLEISLSLARVEAELELAAVSPADEAAPCWISLTCTGGGAAASVANAF